jgi:hypothetical protein
MLSRELPIVVAPAGNGKGYGRGHSRRTINFHA